MTGSLHASDLWGAIRAVFAATAVLWLAAATPSCGGAQFDGTEYRGDEMAFRLGPVPSGGRRIQSDEALVALRNDQVGSTIAVNGRCGLDGDDVPLDALVRHLFIHFQDEETLSEERFQLDGRAALEVELEAELDGVRQHFVVIVLKKDGCVYDFIHVDSGGSSPALEQSRRDFRTMVRGFSTLD